MLVNVQLLLAVALKTPYRDGKPRDSESCEKRFQSTCWFNVLVSLVMSHVLFDGLGHMFCWTSLQGGASSGARKSLCP